MIPLRNAKRFFFKAIQQPGYAMRVFWKRLLAYYNYMTQAGHSSLPESITLFLTHRCNLRCKMCGQWGESGVTKTESPDHIKKELKPEELTRLVDQVGRFRPSITLFGGEPLLHAGCIELIRHIKSKGIHCLMITNGSMLRSRASEIVDAGLDELNVSLDGGRELHDSIRGMDGLYDKIADGLKEVSRAKSAAGKKKPLVNLQCTVTKYNYRRLHELIEVSREIGADSLTFHNLIFLTKEVTEKQKDIDRELNCSSRDWDGFISDPGIDPDILYEEFQKIKSAEAPFPIDIYPNLTRQGLKEYYTDPSIVPSGYKGRCLSPWIVAYVFPDGEVRPCLNSTYSYGNIKEREFKAAWNSQEAARFRSTLKKRESFPVCARCTELYRY